MNLSTTGLSVWAWWRKLWDMTGCKLMIHLFCKRWNCFCSRWLSWRSERTSANIVTLCMNTSSNFSVVCLPKKWSPKYARSFYMKSCTRLKCRALSPFCQRIKLKIGSLPKEFSIWWDWLNPMFPLKVSFWFMLEMQVLSWLEKIMYEVDGNNSVLNKMRAKSNE